MSSLCPNPYLEEFLAEQQRYPADISKVFSVNLVKKRRKKLFQFIDRAADIAEKYGWCIPDERALAVLHAHAPIVELGAGKGYWCSLLQKRGAEVAAFDKKTEFLQKIVSVR